MDTPSRLHNLGLTELKAELDKIAERAAAVSSEKGEIVAELERRYAPRLKALLEQSGKDTGTVTLDVDGFPLKRTTKKEVKYDGEALQKLAASMPWETAAALFKITVDLPEKNYPGLVSNPELKKQVDAARTVTPKAEGIKIGDASA
jgi:hypothetical protein